MVIQIGMDTPKDKDTAKIIEILIKNFLRYRNTFSQMNIERNFEISEFALTVKPNLATLIWFF